MAITLVAGSRVRLIIVTKSHNRLETSLKGLGYPSSERDAGRGHPDANAVGTTSSVLRLSLTVLGRLAWRT